ncbi:plasmid pRiA4b ORF-3 family protein [Clostridium grantii]|uniref:PRiA4b ORF-3-like protein n=1 Tax=Clostridium grantii DSM 8605 TaxID=1121316 RepID=A0A1M5U703_9CLOT|nr:plasmid pRiA4b ORF-3 family protein [Clostridium grantii]SHH58483.1 pRiA4b ORF-3-like protein [Clostridium grantii DSM 8605]
MQIALTKKLSTAMGIKPAIIKAEVNPLFTWTANWTKVWDNRRTEDMLVLVNNATRFTVAVYQVKRKELKNISEIINTAISNTLLAMNFSEEVVAEYMEMSDDIEFVQNNSRQAASWVTKAGLECSHYVGREYDGSEKVFNDTIGCFSNRLIVGCSGKSEKSFYPYKLMREELEKITGKEIYKYKAFELEVTLDLDIYKAIRKIIVPANIKLDSFHKVLQSVFNWRNYHLYDFTVFDKDTNELIKRIVPFEDDLEYDNNAILMGNHTLKDILSEKNYIIYTYDMGDNWEHEIKLINVIEDYDKESPYLLVADGQSPPEDVGGVTGFIEFRDIMMNSKSPEYEEMKVWAGYWNLELNDWQKRPGLIWW